MAKGRMLDKVIILSKKINAISEGAENLYYRILVSTDDYGRYHADPEIIKGQLFTRKKIPVAAIKKRLNELWNIGLIKLYEDDSETYLEVTGFENHQTFRSDMKRKEEYPQPKQFLQGSCNESVTTCNESDRKRSSNISKDKLREVKLSKEECRKYKYSDNHLSLSKLLEKKIKERMPRHRFIGKNYLDDWSNEVRIMEEKKEATLEEIKKLILWIFDEDNFWYKNVLSMDKLRKQFGRLWAEMEGKKSQQSEELLQEWMKEGSDAE